MSSSVVRTTEHRKESYSRVEQSSVSENPEVDVKAVKVKQHPSCTQTRSGKIFPNSSSKKAPSKGVQQNATRYPTGQNGTGYTVDKEPPASHQKKATVRTYAQTVAANTDEAGKSGNLHSPVVCPGNSEGPKGSEEACLTQPEANGTADRIQKSATSQASSRGSEGGASEALDGRSLASCTMRNKFGISKPKGERKSAITLEGERKKGARCKDLGSNDLSSKKSCKSGTAAFDCNVKEPKMKQDGIIERPNGGHTSAVKMIGQKGHNASSSESRKIRARCQIREVCPEKACSHGQNPATGAESAKHAATGNPPGKVTDETAGKCGIVSTNVESRGHSEGDNSSPKAVECSEHEDEKAPSPKGLFSCIRDKVLGFFTSTKKETKAEEETPSEDTVSVNGPCSSSPNKSLSANVNMCSAPTNAPIQAERSSSADKNNEWHGMASYKNLAESVTSKLAGHAAIPIDPASVLDSLLKEGLRPPKQTLGLVRTQETTPADVLQSSVGSDEGLRGREVVPGLDAYQKGTIITEKKAHAKAKVRPQASNATASTSSPKSAKTKVSSDLPVSKPQVTAVTPKLDSSANTESSETSPLMVGGEKKGSCSLKSDVAQKRDTSEVRENVQVASSNRREEEQSIDSLISKRDEQAVAFLNIRGEKQSHPSSTSRRNEQAGASSNSRGEKQSLPSSSIRRDEQSGASLNSTGEKQSIPSPSAKRHEQHGAYFCSKGVKQSLPSSSIRRDEQSGASLNSTGEKQSIPSPSAKRHEQYGAYFCSKGVKQSLPSSSNRKVERDGASLNIRGEKQPPVPLTCRGKEQAAASINSRGEQPFFSSSTTRKDEQTEASINNRGEKQYFHFPSTRRDEQLRAPVDSGGKKQSIPSLSTRTGEQSVASFCSKGQKQSLSSSTNGKDEQAGANRGDQQPPVSLTCKGNEEPVTSSNGDERQLLSSTNSRRDANSMTTFDRNGEKQFLLSSNSRDDEHPLGSSTSRADEHSLATSTLLSLAARRCSKAGNTVCSSALNSQQDQKGSKANLAKTKNTVAMSVNAAGSPAVGQIFNPLGASASRDAVTVQSSAACQSAAFATDTSTGQRLNVPANVSITSTGSATAPLPKSLLRGVTPSSLDGKPKAADLKNPPMTLAPDVSPATTTVPSSTYGVPPQDQRCKVKPAGVTSDSWQHTNNEAYKTKTTGIIKVEKGSAPTVPTRLEFVGQSPVIVNTTRDHTDAVAKKDFTFESKEKGVTSAVMPEPLYFFGQPPDGAKAPRLTPAMQPSERHTKPLIHQNGTGTTGKLIYTQPPTVNQQERKPSLAPNPFCRPLQTCQPTGTRPAAFSGVGVPTVFSNPLTPTQRPNDSGVAFRFNGPATLKNNFTFTTSSGSAGGCGNVAYEQKSDVQGHPPSSAQTSLFSNIPEKQVDKTVQLDSQSSCSNIHGSTEKGRHHIIDIDDDEVEKERSPLLTAERKEEYYDAEDEDFFDVPELDRTASENVHNRRKLKAKRQLCYQQEDRTKSDENCIQGKVTHELKNMERDEHRVEKNEERNLKNVQEKRADAGNGQGNKVQTQNRVVRRSENPSPAATSEPAFTDGRSGRTQTPTSDEPNLQSPEFAREDSATKVAASKKERKKRPTHVPRISFVQENDQSPDITEHGDEDDDEPTEKIPRKGNKKNKRRVKGHGGGHVNFRKSINCCCETVCHLCVP